MGQCAGRVEPPRLLGRRQHPVGSFRYDATGPPPDQQHDSADRAVGKTRSSSFARWTREQNRQRNGVHALRRSGHMGPRGQVQDLCGQVPA